MKFYCRGDIECKQSRSWKFGCFLSTLRNLPLNKRWRPIEPLNARLWFVALFVSRGKFFKVNAQQPKFPDCFSFIITSVKFHLKWLSAKFISLLYSSVHKSSLLYQCLCPFWRNNVFLLLLYVFFDWLIGTTIIFNHSINQYKLYSERNIQLVGSNIIFFIWLIPA